jgi:metal-dependent amidase/aminoacylase/carboxypeptidase family protein
VCTLGITCCYAAPSLRITALALAADFHGATISQRRNPMAIPNLLFVDANIWLDFYRARNETGLQLLRRVENIADKLVVTYQLESEFKKNRQAAILEGMKQLKEPSQIPSPGIFSDATATRVMANNLKEAGRESVQLYLNREPKFEDTNPLGLRKKHLLCQR